MTIPRRTAEERFERLTRRQPDPQCDLWIGGLASSGYPNFWWNGTTWPAYRAAWMLFVGPIPKGLVVRHKCRTPRCVKLTHLELGTHAENERDKDRDGTKPRGERHHQAKLTTADVLEAQQLYLNGLSFLEIAPRFNVHPDTLYRAVAKNNWSHLPRVQARGRGPRKGHAFHKVSPEQVSEMRRLVAMGVPVLRVARQMKVSQQTVRNHLRDD